MSCIQTDTVVDFAGTIGLSNPFEPNAIHVGWETAPCDSEIVFTFRGTTHGFELTGERPVDCARPTSPLPLYITFSRPISAADVSPRLVPDFGVAPTPADGANLMTWHLADWADVAPETSAFEVVVGVDVCDTLDAPIRDVDRYEVHYGASAVTLSMLATEPRPLECSSREFAWKVVAIELETALGYRLLVDPSESTAVTRWHPPTGGEIKLPTMPRPTWVPDKLFYDACAGIGLEDVFVTGHPTDPRIVWLRQRNGPDRATQLVWPPGWTARFIPQLEVLDETGNVVLTEGYAPDGGCVVGTGLDVLMLDAVPLR